ncbi:MULTISPECIES: hypothetical protein [unclassified Streptomyces]|uniref:hypothetical protein n=1 Tax=unclassified Streptomyces TaxID=2593676 RepID=UPI00344C38B3
MRRDPQYAGLDVKPGFRLPHPLVGPGVKRDQFLELDNSDFFGGMATEHGVVNYQEFYMATSRPESKPVRVPEPVKVGAGVTDRQHLLARLPSNRAH